MRAAWLATAGRDGPLAAATRQDAKDYRDALVADRLAPATVNRALGSLALFYDEAATGEGELTGGGIGGSHGIVTPKPAAPGNLATGCHE